jgi:hypothetical protein
MTQDIDRALQGWDFKPGVIQARQVETDDGRQVIQMRVDLGVLQIELVDRPDGHRPHGSPTYFDYLRRQATLAERAGRNFTLDEDQCLEADREFVQFYHRRICCLALKDYGRALADAEHTLAFMDFVRDHSPNEEYTQLHEKYRGFVLYHRTQAAAALAAERDDPEKAIDEIRTGLNKLHEFFTQYGVEDQMDEDAMVQQLRQLERSFRKENNIEETLREQLEQAVAAEDYESAARLRDELRRRQ